MNLNTANLMVGKAASTDPMRMNLNSIHVTAAHTEATNGHILARVSLPYQWEGEDIPGSIPTEPAENIKAFVIPARAAMAIKPFKVKNLACLNGSIFVDVEKTNMNGTARFTMTNLESTLTPELNTIDTVFPDTTRLIPVFTDEDDIYHTRLNIGYLETLLAIAKSIGSEWITIDSRTKCNQAPVLIRTENNGQKFTGLIMPLRD